MNLFVSFTPPQLALNLFGQGRAPHNHAVLLLNEIRDTQKIKSAGAIFQVEARA